MGLERKSSSINVLWYLVELWDPWVLEDTPLFLSNLSKLLFLGSGESDLHPPQNKKKTAVFVAFFRGEGSNIPWLKPTNQSWILSSINMIWKGKFQHPESRMPGVDQKKCSLKCKSIHMDLTGMGETSNSTNHDRKELRWLWVWAFLLFCVCVFLQKVKEISMQNLVHPFARIARNRTCPSNLDTLKTKTRCQANGIPRKIADSGHFLCKHAIVQVPKSKNATILSSFFENIQEHTPAAKLPEDLHDVCCASNVLLR